MLAVSIVLYNTPVSLLDSCLESLKLYPGPLTISILDNSPTPQLAEYFDRLSGISYHHLPSNPGYGRAHNIALRESLAAGIRYHLVLNADVYFTTDVLSTMIGYLDNHPNVGHMMPKVLNPDGTLQRLCKLVPSPLDLILRRVGTTRVRAHSNRRFELEELGYDKIMFVPYLSGCFMLLRTDALRAIGLFDERFFMYPEDVDLSRRMAEKFETLYFPHVHVYHHHGAASRHSLKMLLIHAINMIRYFNKWGWFHDLTRRRLNERTLNQFSSTQPVRR